MSKGSINCYIKNMAITLYVKLYKNKIEPIEIADADLSLINSSMHVIPKKKYITLKYNFFPIIIHFVPTENPVLL